VDEFAPVSFEKEIFHHHSLFDSIHPIMHDLLWRIYQISIKKDPQRQILWTNLLTGHIWLIQELIWFREYYSTIDNSQS
jgi:hypothetical protein